MQNQEEVIKTLQWAATRGEEETRIQPSGSDDDHYYFYKAHVTPYKVYYIVNDAHYYLSHF